MQGPPSTVDEQPAVYSVTRNTRSSFPNPPWPRRRFIGALAAAAAAPASAQFRVEITGIGGNQIPVAIANFRDEANVPVPVSAIVRADLQRSGLFRIVDAPGSFDENSRIVMADWRGRGADALAVGSVSRLADRHCSSGNVGTLCCLAITMTVLRTSGCCMV